MSSATDIETAGTRWVTIETVRRSCASKPQLPASHLVLRDTLSWSMSTERRTNWIQWRPRLGWTSCSWYTTPRWRSRWRQVPCFSCLPPPTMLGCTGFLLGLLASIQELTSHSDVSYQLNLFWLHMRIWYKFGKSLDAQMWHLQRWMMLSTAQRLCWHHATSHIPRASRCSKAAQWGSILEATLGSSQPRTCVPSRKCSFAAEASILDMIRLMTPQLKQWK